jgi:ABC-type transporter Mla subunit MlaD
MDLDDLAGDLLGDLDVDRVRDVVDLVWDNKDELLALVSTLPGLLGDVGEHMQSAGDGAARAGAFLKDDVQELTTKAADTLIDSQARLEAIGKALDGLGDLLDKVPLLGDAGDVLSDGLNALSGVVDDVDEVARQVRALGDRLGDVGGDLDGMGSSLQGGGAALAGFSVGGAGAKPATRRTGGKAVGAGPKSKATKTRR